MPVYPSGGTIAQSVGSPGFGPAPTPSYNASASVRLNPADTAYISFTPTLQSSRTTWTWSGWVKRSGLNTFQNLFSSRSGNELTLFRFGSVTATNDNILFYTQNSAGTATANYTTAAVFRDVSAWYHVLVAIDTTQSTAANRVRIYVNGVLQTLTTTTAVAQYAQLSVNVSGYLHAIGFQPTAGEYFNGYIADVNFVDGLALTPSSFTATDANTGQLVPAQYTGAFGINGFYLPFSSATLAADLGQNPKTTAQDYPYWPYNTLLVDTTSTNGAQNNTFLDSSTNNFTITQNGNTTQGNFTPFTFGGGTAQANGYYSGYFDGTGDYITTPSNAAFNLGTGDFTIETWIYLTRAINNSTLTTILGYGTTLESNGYIIDSGSATTGGFRLVNLTNPYPQVDTLPIQLNTWTHIAFCRSGATLRSFVNGVQNGSISVSANYSPTNSPTLTIAQHSQIIAGREFPGYISNLRLVKGTALYTANFTVPTTPLTNITNTSLLTCQSSQFIDNSTNAFTITANGNSQPLPTNPFGMTDWSGYFDGTGDYLTVPSATATTLDADFTIEYFMYRPAAGNNWILTLGDAFLSSGIETYIGTSGTAFNLYSNNAVRITSSTLPAVGAWSHVAMVRSGSTVTLYLNGVSLGTWTSSATFSGITYIGAERYNGSITGVFTGYLSNVRIVKGTALYTSNFTPPTAPLTAISGTQLLTCQSGTFIDNSPNAFTITVNGNPYTLTLNNPFNNPINYTTPPVQGWSTYFDGSGDYISTTPTALTYGIGTNLFTWESWIYTVNSSATAQGIWHYYTTVVDNFYPYIVSSTGTFNCTIRATNQATTTISSPSGTIRLNQWHHVVVTRDSATNISLYVDGKKVAGGTIAASTSFADTVMNTSNGNNPVIGAITNVVREYFYGYISNLRFVKGTVVYTANFTPPTAPLTAVPGTMTLACQSNRVRDNSILNAAQVANGNTAISPVSPFIPAQSWSAASYGGTMYFDGSGDYLDTPSNAALALGTGDFTVQFWVWFNSHKNFIELIDARGGVNNAIRPVLYTDSAGILYYYNDGANRITSGALPLNSWLHIALTRSGTSTKLFVNGAQAGSTYVDVSNYTQAVWRIGSANNAIPADATNYSLPGYISGLQVLNGTALYTTPFVPPVLPPTNISNTSLLLNATNSGIYDAKGQNVIETVGNAQASTAVKKWGESSMFFDGSGDYLSVQPSVDLRLSGAQTAATNRDFTIETWIYPTTIAYPTSFAVIAIKRGSTAAATGYIFSVTSAGALGFNAGDSITAGWEVALTSSNGAIAANNWYHVAATRQGTTFRMFINGVQVATSSPTAFLIAYDITAPLFIGLNVGESPAYPWYGYMQDFRYTIGAARYQGNFTPPAAAFAYNQYDIGNQQWTPTNISVTPGINQDNLVDSPSDYGTDTGLGGQVRGNYATLNPLDYIINGTISNGNLNFAQSSGPARSGRATIGVSTGKWYWEFTNLGGNNSPGIGNASMSLSTYVGGDANGWSYFIDGTKYNNNVSSAYGAAYTTNDVIGIALDLDAGTLTFYKNGVSQGVAFSGLSGTLFPAFSSSNVVNVSFAVNFGQRAFSYTAPSGFKCLVSTNLPTVNGIGATSTTRASNYFNANLWTGNGTQIPVGFDPSLIWYKATNSVSGAGWVDQIRGDNYYMQTYNTLASTLLSGLLTTNSTGFVPGSAFASNTYVGYSWRGADTLSWSFDGSLERTATMTIASPCVVTLASNGFSPGQAVRFTTTGALPTGIVAGTTYYAGNMVGSTFNLYDTEANAIAGGATGRVDTSGSQSGTQTCEHAARISANPTSGFSVTQYIGVGGTTTVPHGLGAAPEMYIIKCASTTGNWLVFTTALDGSVDYAYLNGQQNLTNAGPGFSTLPTSTVVSLGTDPDANTNGVTYMLYSYVSIPGFSKVGVYTGNGAADGPMIYTNFSPEMMLLKRVSGTPIDNWYNLDVPRSPYNVVSNYLIPNSDQAQGTATFVDFLSNGFKVRAAGAYENAAGSSYLYLAIASAPFKYSRAY